MTTEQTTPDGLTSLSLNPDGGFRPNTLDTGFFSSSDPVLLARLYSSIAQTGQAVYGFQESPPYSHTLDFTAGLAPSLVNPPQPLVLAINPPIITSVSADGPIDEGSASTIVVKARATHENPHHPTPVHLPVRRERRWIVFALELDGGGGPDVQPAGTYMIPIRVVSQEGTFATTSATIQVLNVAPSLVSPGNQSAVEGAPATLSLGQFTDPGNDSPWTERIDWGDGSPVQTLTYSRPAVSGARFTPTSSTGLTR